ncbi:MAG: peptidyl-prolyl cis-trans isomerase [Bacteroidota bacterium]|uniref:peptidyl-prolyl cis-trans isomerase n=1 Tax=Macellibacteroides fermentans TaxID=879969 RepID=UPI002890C23D|nr:peptidyl-prolyl cis-trans isomerase [Bacteroidota bacterium]HML70684.1 peptidyl-prolyl cis-trans isomerase [Macellibacteroides fermentans]
MVRVYFILLTLSVSLFACKKAIQTDEPDALVKVNDRILTRNEVESLIPKGTTSADSLLLAESYIKKWIKDELVLKIAQRNLGSDKETIDKLVDAYRRSLLRYRYQEKLIQEKLSDEIQESDVLTYYDTNKEKFVLDKNLIKGLFLKVPADAPNLSEVKTWYKSGNVASLEKIEKYSIQNAAIYEYFFDKWVDFDEIRNNIPNQISNPESFLRTNKTLEVTDSSFCYLLNIRQVLLKGQVEPFEYAEPRIREILINQRKLDFIKEFEEELYNDALDGGDVIFYNKP